MLAPADAAAAMGMPPPTHTLLAWADKHDDNRIRTVARRVREGLDELNARHAGDAEAREAAAEVKRLSEQLEAAKARYRAAAGTPARTTRPKAGPEHTAQLAAIRTWATANGHQVAPLGRIPRHIVDAYDQAHPAETSGS
jgi:hypothetical protein